MVTFTSCSNYPIDDPYFVDPDRQKENIYYVPTTPNAPFLSKKSDLSFSILRSSDTKFTGMEAQAAFLPTGHFGIIASYASLSNKSGIENFMDYNHFEAGGGYIKEMKNDFVFESYAGIGTGKIRNGHYTGNSDIKLTNYFIQPSISIGNENVKFGFTTKLSGVHFTVIDTLFNTDREALSANEINSLYKQPFHILLEPGFTFKAGWKNFLFQTSYFFSSDLTNSDLYRSKGNFSMGISLHFNTKEPLAKK